MSNSKTLVYSTSCYRAADSSVEEKREGKEGNDMLLNGAYVYTLNMAVVLQQSDAGATGAGLRDYQNLVS